MQPLFITHKYPPSVGGMEKQSYELIEGMAKKYDVKRIVHDGSVGRLKFFFSIVPQVKKILADNPGISFIHLNDGLMGIVGLFIKRIADVPIFVTLHGLDIVFPNKIFQKHIVSRFRNYDGLIPVSSATAKECVKRGMNPGRIFTIRNGVDGTLGDIGKKEDFRQQLEEKLNISLDGKQILVSIGRAVTRKGFSWFIDNVMPGLDDNIIYLIIGSENQNNAQLQSLLKYLPNSIASQIKLLFAVEEDKSKIIDCIKKRNLGDRVFFLGKQNFDSMIQILKHSDLFVMPNIRVNGDAEGFGLVALEAAVCALPVAASNLEGITDAIIGGKNGFLLEPGNAEDWIKFINKQLADPVSLKKFGEEAKLYTNKNYSWEKMVDEYIKVFEENTGKTKSRDKNFFQSKALSVST